MFAVQYSPEQDTRRATLLGISEPPVKGDISYFSGVTLETLKALHAEGFLDLKERQNASPDIAEMMVVMRDIPSARAHGYIVANDRSDRRISLEGLALLPDASPEDVAAFDEWTDETDPDEVTSHYAWWD